jgi:hypothetical protein
MAKTVLVTFSKTANDTLTAGTRLGTKRTTPTSTSGFGTNEEPTKKFINIFQLEKYLIDTITNSNELYIHSLFSNCS